MSSVKSTWQQPQQPSSHDQEEKTPSFAYVKTLQDLDDIIGEYYIYIGEGQHYYKDLAKRQGGKFKAFVDENQFDDDSLEEEFADDMEIANCSYLDFDADHTFPFDKPLKNESERDEKLYNFLKYCYVYGRYPTIISDPNKINFDILDSFLDSNKKESIRQLYIKQCPTICQQIALNADENMLMGLTVGNENKIPFLQYLCDIYQRDRMQLKLDNDNTEISVAKWCSRSRFMQQIQKRYKNGAVIVTMMQHAIQSYIKRIEPQFETDPIGFAKISDDIWEIVRYFQCATSFIQFILRQKTDESTVPFQWDFSIAVKEAICAAAPLKVPGIRDSDDDNESTEEKYYDCIGSIKHKLKVNNLINHCDVIDRQEESNEEVRSVTRIFAESYNTFKHKFDASFPKNRRFISVVDRRKYVTKYRGKIPKIKLEFKKRNENEKDEILFYAPPNNASHIPDVHVPEIYFNNLRQCLIPDANYIDEEIEYKTNRSVNALPLQLDKSENYLINKKVLSNITSHESCNGGLLTFSFNVEQDDEIKCYLWWQAKCIRFLPADIIDILGQLFDQSFEANKTFNKNSIEAKQIVTSIKYKDVHFNNWFQKISILDNPIQHLTKYVIPTNTHQNY